MKTLNDLKRHLQTNAVIIMTKCSCGNKLIGKKRKVVQTQTNGVYFIDPEDPTSRKSFLSFPKASLLEYDGKYIRIYETGKRKLTKEEKTIKDGYEKIRNKKQEEIDLMTDCSTSFWKEKAYYREHNAEYLMGHTTQKGMRFDYNTGKVWDDNIKGKLNLEYEWIN